MQYWLRHKHNSINIILVELQTQHNTTNTTQHMQYWWRHKHNSINIILAELQTQHHKHNSTNTSLVEAQTQLYKYNTGGVTNTTLQLYKRNTDGGTNTTLHTQNTSRWQTHSCHTYSHIKINAHMHANTDT